MESWHTEMFQSPCQAAKSQEREADNERKAGHWALSGEFSS